MNGTSASAPQVTGLVALMFQYHAKAGTGIPLNAVAIIDLLKKGARKSAKLRPDRHQEADDARPIKQSQMLKRVVGAGKVNVIETLKLL